MASRSALHSSWVSVRSSARSTTRTSTFFCPGVMPIRATAAGGSARYGVSESTSTLSTSSALSPSAARTAQEPLGGREHSPQKSERPLQPRPERTRCSLRGDPTAYCCCSPVSDEAFRPQCPGAGELYQAHTEGQNCWVV